MDRACGGRQGAPLELWERHDGCDERRALRARMRLEGAYWGLVGRGRRGLPDDQAGGAAAGPGHPSPRQLGEAGRPSPEPQGENLSLVLSL